MIWGRQGTRNASKSSTDPPEERGNTRVAGLMLRDGRSPVVVPAPRLQTGMHGGGGELSLLLTAAVTARPASLPAPSRARTSNECSPFARSSVSYANVYGSSARVSTRTPSIHSSTVATPRPSNTPASIKARPLSVSPFAGRRRDTSGAVRSTNTRTSREDRVTICAPSASSARTVRRWAPSVHASESHGISNAPFESASDVAVTTLSTRRRTEARGWTTLPCTRTAPWTEVPYVGARIVAPRTWSPGSHNTCVRGPVAPETVSATERLVGFAWSTCRSIAADAVSPASGGDSMSNVVEAPGASGRATGAAQTRAE